jgi:hypothetical protein
MTAENYAAIVLLEGARGGHFGAPVVGETDNELFSRPEIRPLW